MVFVDVFNFVVSYCFDMETEVYSEMSIGIRLPNIIFQIRVAFAVKP